MSINVNTSVLEHERLTSEREFLRIERKRINRERYQRHYSRLCKGKAPWWTPRWIRISDIVTVTIGPTVCWGPIGSDSLT